MKIDFDALMKDFQNKVISEGGKNTTLAAVACTALSAQFADEANLAADEKYRRYKLGCKLADGGAVDLSVDEIAMLKKLIGRAFSPLIVGRSFDVLDPPSQETTAK